MAFTDKIRDLGNHVKFAVNTKGTSKPGIPTAVAEMSRTQSATATETPTTLTTTGTATRGLRELKKKTLRTKI
jgi:hypothetical protein